MNHEDAMDRLRQNIQGAGESSSAKDASTIGTKVDTQVKGGCWSRFSSLLVVIMRLLIWNTKRVEKPSSWTSFDKIILQHYPNICVLLET